MRKTIKKPYWFPLKIYYKNLSYEEWLDEISTRVSLIGELFVERPREEAKNIFIKKIIGKSKPKLSESLTPNPHYPIKPIPAIDILQMHKRITESSGYRNHPLKEKIEEIIDNNKDLTKEQKKNYEKILDTYWYAFEDEGNPFVFMKYMQGTPMLINFNVERSILVLELKKWINLYREQKKLNKKMLPISQKLLNDWTEKNILAVFDLIVWFDICGIDLKNHKSKISEIIWPITPNTKEQNDTPADPAEFLDIAIELSQKAITPATINGLFLYCESNAWTNNHKIK